MLELSLQAWLQINAAVQWKPTQEISGFGRTTLQDFGKVVRVEEIVVPPQQVGGAHIEFDVARGDLDWFFDYVAKRGESPADWRFWWHSHAKMGVQPSSTDHNTLKMLAQQYGGWATGAVFNALGAAHGWAAYRLDGAFPPAGTTLWSETDLTLEIEEYEDPAITAAIRAACEENVKVKTYTPPATSYKPPATGNYRGPWWAKKDEGRKQPPLMAQGREIYYDAMLDDYFFVDGNEPAFTTVPVKDAPGDAVAAAVEAAKPDAPLAIMNPRAVATIVNQAELTYANLSKRGSHVWQKGDHPTKAEKKIQDGIRRLLDKSALYGNESLTDQEIQALMAFAEVEFAG